MTKYLSNDVLLVMQFFKCTIALMNDPFFKIINFEREFNGMRDMESEIA